MKLSILQENLAKGLSVVNRFIINKSQLPILNNILIKTDQGQLKLSATNLEIVINLWLGSKIEKEGEICVPAKVLTEYINSLPAEKINLAVNKNTLNINSSSYQADFITLSSSEFPIIPTLKKKPDLIFSNQDLALAISQVCFAAGQDEARPALTGILIKIKKDGLLLVATDGYRLSLKKIKEAKGLDKLSEKQKELLIPSRALIEVGKIISDSDQEEELGLSITSENNQIIFSNKNLEVISRLIEGKFPDFERIIPSKNTTKITLDTESFFQAVRTAAIFARESANIIKLDFKDNQVELSSNSPQVGENKIKLEVKMDGKGGQVAFNYRYLLEFLNSVKSDLITLEINTSLDPGVFKQVDDPSYLHIIMPIRIQE